jgi:hypothetical protein
MKNFPLRLISFVMWDVCLLTQQLFSGGKWGSDFNEVLYLGGGTKSGMRSGIYISTVRQHLERPKCAVMLHDIKRTQCTPGHFRVWFIHKREVHKALGEWKNEVLFFRESFIQAGLMAYGRYFIIDESKSAQSEGLFDAYLCQRLNHSITAWNTSSGQLIVDNPHSTVTKYWLIKQKSTALKLNLGTFGKS